MKEVTYRITQIEPQKKNEGRVNVYLDGAFAFGLDEEVVLRHHLHEDDEITEHMIDDILLAEERTRAKEKALRLLSYRSRSVEELKKRLRERNFSERTVDRVIQDFLRVGLLDDKKFASSYVHSRMTQRPIGKRLLKRELLDKGIAHELAEEAVEEVYGVRSELEVATDLIQSRIRHYKGEEKKKAQKKLSDFLLRRGFNWDVITTVLQEGL